MKKKSSFFFRVFFFCSIIIVNGNNVFSQKLLEAFKKRDLALFCSLVQNKPKLAYQKSNKLDILSILCVREESTDDYINCLLNACPTYGLAPYC